MDVGKGEWLTGAATGGWSGGGGIRAAENMRKGFEKMGKESTAKV